MENPEIVAETLNNLLLNYEFAVIASSAWKASLPTSASCPTDQGQQHGLLQES